MLIHIPLWAEKHCTNVSLFRHRGCYARKLALSASEYAPCNLGQAFRFALRRMRSFLPICLSTVRHLATSPFREACCSHPRSIVRVIWISPLGALPLPLLDVPVPGTDGIPSPGTLPIPPPLAMPPVALPMPLNPAPGCSAPAPPPAVPAPALTALGMPPMLPTPGTVPALPTGIPGIPPMALPPAPGRLPAVPVPPSPGKLPPIPGTLPAPPIPGIVPSPGMIPPVIPLVVLLLVPFALLPVEPTLSVPLAEPPLPVLVVVALLEVFPAAPWAPPLAFVLLSLSSAVSDAVDVLLLLPPVAFVLPDEVMELFPLVEVAAGELSFPETLPPGAPPFPVDTDPVVEVASSSELLLPLPVFAAVVVEPPELQLQFEFEALEFTLAGCVVCGAPQTTRVAHMWRKSTTNRTSIPLLINDGNMLDV